MEPFIKVCGIQTVAEALGAIDAGANTLGFLIGLTHRAEDGISAATGKTIVEAVPDHIRTVLVTHLLDAAEIAEIARSVGVRAIQIHDDLPVVGVLELRRLLPDVELIKAIHVTGEDALQKAQEYEEYVDRLLLDSRTKDRLGGTGQTHDWNLSRKIVQTVSIPVILAGGLKPENVATAIGQVRPAGIDANSGLEQPDGTKDFDKIRAFARFGRQCRFPTT
ncbi:phosphoribosylanthranilate isomerase [Larkinella rosea]|uniref:N-(5'-phosphoribosyl)anthranilate isomerase n=1 Tax=Larkinella rosea TaxID=2025312 RepID=A0A3P1BFE9_9BACT|nr:phosphoribosylanthranilate isomerase [Larkinella rosea]RRA99806.1 phosphoribosylanthranilate isomerase [Larkinella rosea]